MPGPKAPQEERREQILAAAGRVAANETLAGLTIRRVAEAAELSVGLVLFHFGSKDGLLLAMLDRLLEQTLRETEAAKEAARDPSPRETLRKLLRREIERLPRERERVELFFDFWVMGTRQPEIRARVRASLERYRNLVTDVTGPLLSREPNAFGGMTAEGMAALAVSFIEGGALQAVIDPAHFDVAAYLTAVDVMLDTIAGPA